MKRMMVERHVNWEREFRRINKELKRIHYLQHLYEALFIKKNKKPYAKRQNIWWSFFSRLLLSGNNFQRFSGWLLYTRNKYYSSSCSTLIAYTPINIYKDRLSFPYRQLLLTQNSVTNRKRKKPSQPLCCTQCLIPNVSPEWLWQEKTKCLHNKQTTTNNWRSTHNNGRRHETKQIVQNPVRLLLLLLATNKLTINIIIITKSSTTNYYCIFLITPLIIIDAIFSCIFCAWGWNWFDVGDPLSVACCSEEEGFPVFLIKHEIICDIFKNSLKVWM